MKRTVRKTASKTKAPAAAAAVTVTQAIQAEPAAVFEALTHAWDWGKWLCREAEVDARPKGQWCAIWDGGFEASGVFGTVAPGERVSFTWSDRWNPEGSRVDVRLSTEGDGTKLVLKQSGFPAGPAGKRAAAEAGRGWPRALENLKSHVEEGIDSRTARRPILGVHIDVLDAEKAPAAGTEPGRVRITSVIPLTGADRGGLVAGDVVLAIGGKDVKTTEDLARVLGAHRAGEVVEVRFLRDGKRGRTRFDLGGRPVMEVPADPAELVMQARQQYSVVFEEMTKLLAGVSDEDASKPEAPGKWSVKEVLAHLSVAERDSHHFAVLDILGEVPHTKENPTVAPERLAAAIAVAHSVRELLARWKRDVEEGFALFLAMRPEARRNKAKYRVIGEGLLFNAEHGRMHLAQVRRVLGAARGDAEG